jgi:hypothetical protein
MMNLPAVIYCRFYTSPDPQLMTDSGFGCWIIGFFLKIPYYAAIIFVSWSLIDKTLGVWQQHR